MSLTFYFLLLIGSLAFGLEALMLGMGGKIIPLYKSRPLMVLSLSTLLGFWIVIISLTLGLLLALEPIYICAVVLILTIASGRLVQFMKPDLVKKSPPIPEPISEKEIKKTLRKQGLEKVVKKKK